MKNLKCREVILLSLVEKSPDGRRDARQAQPFELLYHPIKVIVFLHHTGFLSWRTVPGPGVSPGRASWSAGAGHRWIGRARGTTARRGRDLQDARAAAPE